MNGLKDNYGAEIGMRVTCQRCRKQIFRAQIGYNNLDAATSHRHSFLDEFESMPKGWKLKHDLNGWCCPDCIKEYELFLEKFNNKRNFDSRRIQ